MAKESRRFKNYLFKEKEDDNKSALFHVWLTAQRQKVAEVRELKEALEELSDAVRPLGLRYSSSMLEILLSLVGFDEGTRGENHKTLCYLIGEKLVSPEISFAQLGNQLDLVLKQYSADIFEDMDELDEGLPNGNV